MVNKIISVILCIGWIGMIAVLVTCPQYKPLFEKVGSAIMSTYILIATSYLIYSFDKSK